jgi:hypothetical protein
MMIPWMVFRVWDPSANCFTTSGVQFNNTTMTLDTIPGITLEQFIGQVDAHKKNIFVGDVLKNKYTHYLQVIATRYGWALRYIDEGQLYIDPILDPLDDDLVIVGNIHQHKDMDGIKELLERK